MQITQLQQGYGFLDFYDKGMGDELIRTVGTLEHDGFVYELHHTFTPTNTTTDAIAEQSLSRGAFPTPQMLEQAWSTTSREPFSNRPPPPLPPTHPVHPWDLPSSLYTISSAHSSSEAIAHAYAGQSVVIGIPSANAVGRPANCQVALSSRLTSPPILAVPQTSAHVSPVLLQKLRQINSQQLVGPPSPCDDG